MGIFKWLKKELEEFNLSKRRVSAPPLSTSNFNANLTRDEAYLRALSKFNDWRTSQIQTSTSHDKHQRRKTTDAVTHINTSDDEDDDDDDNEFTEEEKEKLLFDNNVDLISVKTKIKSSVALKNKTNNNKKNSIKMLTEKEIKDNYRKFHVNRSLSMPLTSDNDVELSTPHNYNDIIYESDIKSFENKHCLQKNGFDDYDGNYTNLNSPPVKFYKENSIPFSEEKHRYKKRSKRSPKSFDKEFKTTTPSSTISKASRNKKYSKIEKTVKSNTMEKSIHLNGTYKSYEINLSSYDEHSESTKEKSVSFSDIDGKPIYNDKSRNSPPYQTVINKHGEMVEYALPYCESISNDEHGDKIIIDTNQEYLNDVKTCQEIINQNILFLTKKYGNRSTVNLIEILNNQIQESLLKKPEVNTLVTDLDELSIELSKNNIRNSQDEMFNELESLEKWSNNIVLSDNTFYDNLNQSYIDYFQKKYNGFTIAWPNEISGRTGILRNTFPSLLDYSSGVFRNTPVTLRKYRISTKEMLRYAAEATKRDFEILNQVKHSDITILMSICFDRVLNHITLILEPYDFTLNYYIHQMEKKFTLMECIQIVQQIGTAAMYLQECGYIHSNISSHCILIRSNPFCVKLSSFELATEVNDDIKNKIELEYDHIINEQDDGSYKKIPEYSFILRNRDKFLHDKYVNMSKQTFNLKDEDNYNVIELPAQYLPYSIDYRRKFSTHYYQPPELITTTSTFVFPTKMTDVYSLSLLLWELLNNCVPFVIFNYAELEKLYIINQAILPIFETSRCSNFMKIFDFGLKVSIDNRIMTIQHLISLLEEIKNKITNNITIRNEEQLLEDYKFVNSDNIINESFGLKNIDKKYFSKKHMYANLATDPQKRLANVLTEDFFESIDIIKNQTIDEILGVDNQIAQINDKQSLVIKEQELLYSDIDTNKNQNCEKIKPKKPPRKVFDKKNEKLPPNEIFNNKNLQHLNEFIINSNEKHSSLSNASSLNDFTKFLMPTLLDNENYERTSTLKKKIKPTGEAKRSVKELFKTNTKMDYELAQIPDSIRFSREDFLQMKMSDSFDVINNISFDKEINKNKDTKKNKTMEKDMKLDKCLNKKKKHLSVSTMRNLDIDNIILPDTPIARKNKIRKHVWLSNQNIPSQEIADNKFNRNNKRVKSVDILEATKIEHEINENQNGIINLNIKLIHNKQQSSQSQLSDKKILQTIKLKISPESKQNKQEKLSEENKSNDIVRAQVKEIEQSLPKKGTLEKITKTYERIIKSNRAGTIDCGNEDADNELKKKLPQELNEAILKQRERHGLGSKVFEKSLWRREIQRCTTIKSPREDEKYETRVTNDDKDDNAYLRDEIVENKTCDYNTPVKVIEEIQMQHNTTPPVAVSTLNVTLSNGKDHSVCTKEPVTQIVTPINTKNSLNTNNLGTLQPTKNITKSNRNSLVITEEVNPSKCLTPEARRLTTRVTLSFRKIGRRLSDVGTSSAGATKRNLFFENDKGRHSLCSSEILSSINQLKIISDQQKGEKVLTLPLPEQVASSEAKALPIATTSGNNLELVPLKTSTKLATCTERRPLSKLLCCNCGSHITADELRQIIQDNLDISIPYISEIGICRNELNDSLVDKINLKEIELPLSAISTLKRCQTLPTIQNAKSTEDIYIDDDFCQNSFQLGANIELVADCTADFMDDLNLDMLSEDFFEQKDEYDN